MAKLTLETKTQPNETVTFAGGRGQFTPPISEDYWLYRVRLSETQSIVGFPKFSTIGIGFAREDEDWNTNLPFWCEVTEIFQHISHNKGDGSISDADVLKAIRMIRSAVLASPSCPRCRRCGKPQHGRCNAPQDGAS